MDRRCGIFLLLLGVCLFEAAFFFFTCDEVADGHFGFYKNHAWAAVAHDGANLFTHIRTVAVNVTIGAEGFVFHEGAMVATCVGIVFEGGTFRAESFLGVMHALAVESNHFADDNLFFGAFLFNVCHRKLLSLRCS